MQKMSMAEFSDYLRETRFNQFILSSENQVKYKMIEYLMRFDNISIVFNPNSIVLKNKLDYLKISHVRRIDVESVPGLTGVVFNVIYELYDKQQIRIIAQK